MKLTIENVNDYIMNNEPSFMFKGVEYMICFPDGKFHCGITDSPQNDEIFDSIDDMLEKWIIDGNRFKDIIEKIKF